MEVFAELSILQSGSQSQYVFNREEILRLRSEGANPEPTVCLLGNQTYISALQAIYRHSFFLREVGIKRGGVLYSERADPEKGGTATSCLSANSTVVLITRYRD